ncbi:(2Fe-2S)-binding protein [Pseudonocardia sp.]|uniref:(2Fe-2S)-binding protein n=1 Tax=Pseudonocardia sp. TaxID=60912 RepID=UPI003D0D3EB7
MTIESVEAPEQAVAPDPALGVVVEELTVRLTVNGVEHEQRVEPRLSLADLLRDRLRLTGTKLGCEHGMCGACTVLLDGAAVRSCLVLAVQADSHEVRTVEGLTTGTDLNGLQASFREHHALQCGFCTSGFLMSATALLEQHPSPEEAQVREAFGGNLCRCTGYATIVDAVLDVTHRAAHDAAHDGAAARAAAERTGS